MLALLITAATGAWAEDVDGTIAWSVGNEASATVSASIKDAISSTGVTTGSGLDVSTGNYFETNMVKYTPATANAGNVEGVMIEYTIEAVDGYKFKPTGVDYAAVKVGADLISYSWSYTIDGVESAITDVSNTSVLRNNGSNSGTAQLMHNESITAEGCSVFTLRFYISNCGTTKNICIGNITISGSVSVAEAPIEVTTNKAEGETTFTEASFNMPAFDATAEYELVRDMTVDVDATIADRIRIQKENNAYVAVTATELIPAVSDKISGTDVAMTVTTDYTAQLQKKTEGDTPTWADATTLSVGTFRYVITGTGLYDGKITTNEFQLFEGYEVTIPAGEYATYFKDEALYVENENAQLYTISSVTESEAVLSDAITVAPANTPLLVYNKSEQDKTFLLIPTTDKTPDNVTAATQFVGTLVATTIPASATGADNYALNGYAFVWVKNEIAVAANKCWLHIASQPAAARAMTRSIVGGNGTTGIDAIENVTIDNEGWYDLQGRKLQAKPNRGGIYIHNGRKVVVH